MAPSLVHQLLGVIIAGVARMGVPVRPPAIECLVVDFLILKNLAWRQAAVFCWVSISKRFNRW